MLLPTVGAWLYMTAYPTQFAGKDKGILLLSIFFNSFVMPVISFLLMKALGFIQSLEMEDAQERIIPFISAMIFYIWTFLAVKKLSPETPMMLMFFLGVLISLVMSFVINLFQKLSIHMVGISGLTTAIFIMMNNAEISVFPYLLAAIFACGLVGTARLYLKAHTLRQVYYGLMVGISGQMLGTIIYLKFMV